MKTKILSGIQPSGMLHIGNQLGSIRQWLMFQEVNTIFRHHHLPEPLDNYFFIADMHCWTDQRNYLGSSMKDSILTCQLMLLASGLNPDYTHIYLQSRIKSLGKFYYLINSLSSLARLERMHHWKEKTDKSDPLKTDRKLKWMGVDGVEYVSSDLTQNVALLTYPCLMTADILSQGPDYIPVGQDQIQHLNFTNDIINELNRVTYNKLNFKQVNNDEIYQKIDEILKNTQILEKKRFQDPKTNQYIDPKQINPPKMSDFLNIKIKSMRNPNVKMSKSVENSFISLQDSDDVISKSVKGALTDNQGEIGECLEGRDGVKNMLNIIRLIYGTDFDSIHHKQLGKDIRKLKSDLREILIGFIQPIRSLQEELDKDRESHWIKLNKDSDKMSEIFDERFEEIEKRFYNYD